MDGRNASGRRISLLNDEATALAAIADSAAADHFAHLRPACQRNADSNSSDSSNSSNATTSTLDSVATAASSMSRLNLPNLSIRSRTSLSPDPPALCRSQSAESSQLPSPSPVSPYDGHRSQQEQQVLRLLLSGSPIDSAKHPAPDPVLPPSLSFNYPALPGPAPPPAAAAPEPPTLHHPADELLKRKMKRQQLAVARSTRSPTPIAPLTSTTTPSTAQVATKKNNYPCPMAKQLGCEDRFTTSGHAARHAKKHTGRKDAFCPECNKAFTRKDNMEQHRRTHQSGRNVAKAAAVAAAAAAAAAAGTSSSSSSSSPASSTTSTPTSTISSPSSPKAGRTTTSDDRPVPIDPSLSLSLSLSDGPITRLSTAQQHHYHHHPYPDKDGRRCTAGIPAAPGLETLALVASGLSS